MLNPAKSNIVNSTIMCQNFFYHVMSYTKECNPFSRTLFHTIKVQRCDLLLTQFYFHDRVLKKSVNKMCAQCIQASAFSIGIYTLIHHIVTYVVSSVAHLALPRYLVLCEQLLLGLQHRTSGSNLSTHAAPHFRDGVCLFSAIPHFG